MSMYKTKEESLPKGIIEQYYDYHGPFEKAISIAQHYGFHLVPPVKSKKKSREPNAGTWYIAPEEKDLSLKHYSSRLKKRPHPVKVCYTLHHRRKMGNIKLEIFGCKKSIAEALLLRTALAILEEHKHKNLHIDINSRGCKNSSETFLEEYKNYYRKHANKVSTCCQTTLRNNPLDLVLCNGKECSKLRESAPRSIAFLAEPDRAHLKEVIEYIESMNVPYCINSQLVGHEQSHPRTLFQIKSLKKTRSGEIRESNVVARGERFDYLTYNKENEEYENHAVSISIDIPAGKYESYKEVDHKDVVNPQIYFVHISSDAKRESLPILETLRQHNIRVREALMRDSLWQQMRHAEHLKVPYVVIMGLQEVKERAVIVRNLETQAQETVPFNRLAMHLKRLVR